VAFGRFFYNNPLASSLLSPLDPPMSSRFQGFSTFTRTKPTYHSTQPGALQASSIISGKVHTLSIPNEACTHALSNENMLQKVKHFW